jgi:hypothetical protein
MYTVAQSALAFALFLPLPLSVLACHSERSEEPPHLLLLLLLSFPFKPTPLLGVPIHGAVSPQHGWGTLPPPALVVPFLLVIPQRDLLLLLPLALLLHLGTPRLQPWVSLANKQKGL